jgi:hypothetical protein
MRPISTPPKMRQATLQAATAQITDHSILTHQKSSSQLSLRLLLFPGSQSLNATEEPDLVTIHGFASFRPGAQGLP